MKKTVADFLKISYDFIGLTRFLFLRAWERESFSKSGVDKVAAK